MATLQLYTGENTLISGSGLGFFGDDGFGAPIVIGEYNGHTFVTNASGTTQGFESNNNKYNGVSGVIHGQEGSGIYLQNLPNELATINIRFTNTIAIYCQRVRAYIFDGSYTGDSPNRTTPPTGLTFYGAEIRHTSNLQSVSSAYSDSSWDELSVSGSNYLSLVESPGRNGVRGAGLEELSTRHDWYMAMTCTPTELGDKQFGINIDLEYL